MALASYLFSTRAVGIAVVGLASVAAAVACVRLWRTHTALVATTLASSAVTLLWPFVQDRLFLPLLPFLGLLAAATLERAVAGRPVRVAWGARIALGVAALAVTLRQFELREAAARAYWAGTVTVEDRSSMLTLAVRTRYIRAWVVWVNRSTTPQDRIMVDAPAAIYLYTGRRTVPGQPTESPLGASVFETPGRYLAERVLDDSVTVVIWAPPAPDFGRDILAVAAQCPRVLQRVPTRAVYFRVARDEICLRQRFLQGEASP
jgi:hypothetical protein